MIILFHKRNKTEYPVTAEVFAKIQARPNWQATYKVIQSPPKEPKEIKKLSGKQKPEFEQDGLSTNDAHPVVEDTGQEQ